MGAVDVSTSSATLTGTGRSGVNLDDAGSPEPSIEGTSLENLAGEMSRQRLVLGMSQLPLGGAKQVERRTGPTGIGSVE
jgi:hypothetical protein